MTIALTFDLPMAAKLAAVATKTGAETQVLDRDGALIEAFRAGDRGAFDELVRRYQKPIYYMALRYLKNDADAMDIAQRTFIRAYKALDRFRGTATVRSWLYRIAINLSLNHLRDSKREQPTEIPEAALRSEPIGAQRIEDAQRSQALRNAIAELPPKQRLVLELRIYDELGFREVAGLADCSVNAAKVNFHHAVKRLRELVRLEDPPTATNRDANNDAERDNQ